MKFDRQIKKYPGLIWGCNRAFVDYGPFFDLMAGHVECMIEAKEFRERNGWKYVIAGNIGTHPIIEQGIDCPKVFRKDTGTTLVAYALEKGFDVIACGFDIGGSDCYSPDHETLNKSVWVNRWRLILGHYGQARIKFWGHNHKPFLLSTKPSDFYYRKYSRGEAHIPGIRHVQGLDVGQIPKIMVKNIGSRAWGRAYFPDLLPGETKPVFMGVAQKMVSDYPKEFQIEGDYFYDRIEDPKSI